MRVGEDYRRMNEEYRRARAKRDEYGWPRKRQRAWARNAFGAGVCLLILALCIFMWLMELTK